MAEQRLETLGAYLNNRVQPLRPLLVSLNGDNSWLISLPRPSSQQKQSGKAYFHIVYDPWLVGPATQWKSWLVWMTLRHAPEIKNGEDVESLVDEIESAAAVAGYIQKPSEKAGPHVDAILLGFLGPDHTHRPTLESMDSRIPVFAPQNAAKEVRSWNHFAHVICTTDLKPGNGKWHEYHPGAPLPEWISFFRLVGHASLNFATVVVWMSDTGEHETLLLSPHVIRSDARSLQTFARDLAPPVRPLAIMCPLKDSFAFGIQTVLGADGALALERFLKPKYWIVSADAELQYFGLVMTGVKDVRNTLNTALAKEQQRQQHADKNLKRPNLVEIQNGHIFVLEH